MKRLKDDIEALKQDGGLDDADKVRGRGRVGWGGGRRRAEH